jgi:eukaryotic-like serine/threonine-protein kinase
MVSITAQQWQRAQELFLGALEQSYSSREAWLLRASSEGELLTLVRNMLHQDAVLGDQTGMNASHILAASEQPELNIGAELGPYRIVGFLGAGGMGQVFRAERIDGVVRQEVAIKLLRHSGSAFELRRRFALERRILARLSHPGIARFIDAGADNTGRPYVVMELINGMPITIFARQHKLDLSARLLLFLQVLDAVSYAHAQLIVHRDIKPDNVLVDQFGTPRLLDFGIAKPISDIDDALRADGHTETLMRAFSLKYAAPEQIKGEVVGVGCDIYALGGLLYELLTGHSALDLHDLAMLKAQEKVCNQLPSLPSERQLPADFSYSNKLLKGDLDRIVLHALKKEARERYITVAAFTADLSSYLKREPISLRNSMTSYRIGKFISRHKLPVGIAALLFLSLVILVATLLRSNISIRHEKALAKVQQIRANAEAKSAIALSEFWQDLFATADPNHSKGKNLSVRDVLDAGVGQLEIKLAEAPAARTRLLLTIAKTYRQLSALDAALVAITSADRAMALLDLNTTGALRIEVAQEQARIYADLGKMRRALQAIASAKTLEAEIDAPPLVRASTLNIEASVFNESQNWRQALPLLQQTLAIRKRYGAAKQEIASTLNNLGFAMERSGELIQANRFFSEAYALYLTEAGEKNIAAILTLSNWARSERDLGRFAQADSAFARVHNTLSELFPNPDQPHPALGFVIIEQGISLRMQDRMGDALARLDHACKGSACAMIETILLRERATIYAAQGNAVRANKLIQEAMGKAVAKTSVGYGRLEWRAAQIQEKLGHRKQAIMLLESALHKYEISGLHIEEYAEASLLLLKLFPDKSGILKNRTKKTILAAREYWVARKLLQSCSLTPACD